MQLTQLGKIRHAARFCSLNINVIQPGEINIRLVKPNEPILAFEMK